MKSVGPQNLHSARIPGDPPTCKVGDSTYEGVSRQECRITSFPPGRSLYEKGPGWARDKALKEMQ